MNFFFLFPLCFLSWAVFTELGISDSGGVLGFAFVGILFLFTSAIRDSGSFGLALARCRNSTSHMFCHYDS
jgi:hypothetical protein